jgi:hypothetical protein
VPERRFSFPALTTGSETANSYQYDRRRDGDQAMIRATITCAPGFLAGLFQVASDPVVGRLERIGPRPDHGVMSECGATVFGDREDASARGQSLNVLSQRYGEELRP